MRHAVPSFSRVVTFGVVPALLATALAAAAPAQSTGGAASAGFRFLHPAATTRIADPKLEGGGCQIQYLLDPGPQPYDVKVAVLQNGNHVATVFHGTERGSPIPKAHLWDGRDASGKWLDPGSYTIRVTAKGAVTRRVEYPLDLVRLGLVNIAADPTNGTNEWQTVYFMKSGLVRYYATPATGEWVSIAEKGEISDLDRDDASPRPAPAVWNPTDEPALEPNSSGGFKYEDDTFNYPLCYLAGAQPQFTATLGATCTSVAGTQIGCNYPVAGFELRLVAHDESGDWSSANNSSLAPGGIVSFLGPALTNVATRTDRHLDWHWQYRATGAAGWSDVPGRFRTEHRFFTILHAPYFVSGASGTQYSGPWVEVLDYIATWQAQFGITPDSDERVVELLIKGFNGQPTLTHAIENVVYDCPSNGGDGGATHYYDFGRLQVNLSHLLDAHSDGIYVNCSDCASSTSVMLGMLGINGVQMEHLGSMQLRAIWGIGCKDYTTDLWGNGNSGFSYHHIITRDAGVHISDACLWIDEDGDPDHKPGTPGFNCDRDWSSYESLLAKGSIQWNLDVLPKIK